MPDSLVYVPGKTLLATLKAFGIVGAVVFVLGLFVEPAGVWTGFLIGFCYVTGLAVAGGLFIAVLYLSSARWGTPLRRIPEAMASTLPLIAVLGIVLLFGVGSLYEWSHAKTVEGDEVLQLKSGYLNTTWFAIRLVICFAAWIWVTRKLVGRSRQQDVDGDPMHYKRNVRTSAFFMVVLTITYSIASFDWLMSLEPHWFSTIFALYQLAGAALSGLAVATALAVLLRWQGSLRGFVTDDHFQILGRLLLSLSVFWVYVWYAQFMLIWYAHIPEETVWYAARKQVPWSLLTPTILVLNWLVPFLVLLPKAACRSGQVLLRVAGVILVGHALELFLHVGPPVLGHEPIVGLWAVAPVVGAVSMFFYFTLTGLRGAAVVPRHDPTLERVEPISSPEAAL